MEFRSKRLIPPPQSPWAHPPKMARKWPFLAIFGSFLELFPLTPYRYRDPICGGLGPFGAIFGDSRRTHACQNIFPPGKRAIFSGHTPRDTGFFGALGRVRAGPGQVAATLRSAGPASDRPGHPWGSKPGGMDRKTRPLKKT